MLACKIEGAPVLQVAGGLHPRGTGKQAQTSAPGKPGRFSTSLKGYDLKDVEGAPNGDAPKGKRPSQRPPGVSGGGRSANADRARPAKKSEAPSTREGPESEAAGSALGSVARGFDLSFSWT